MADAHRASEALARWRQRLADGPGSGSRAHEDARLREARRVEDPKDVRKCHFIDLDHGRAELLKVLAKEALAERPAGPKVFVYQGDCNEVLLEDVLPRAKYEDRRRALCLVDPYGLDLDWEVLRRAGEMRSVDLLLNFPIMDMNRNALWRKTGGVTAASRARMTAFWGDESWKTAAYRKEPTLFGDFALGIMISGLRTVEKRLSVSAQRFGVAFCPARGNCRHFLS